jgi:hypothetical protein
MSTMSVTRALQAAARDGLDHRATVGPMQQKSTEKKSSPDRKRRQNEPDLSRSISFEPAPIDMAAFGKRLGEIITKSVRAPGKRHKSRS